MKTREQVTATGDFEAAPWLADDIAGRNAAWLALAGKCAEIAAAKGMEVVENTPAADRSVLYMRTADDGNGGSRAVECSRDEAEFVRLRLSAWAVPK